MAFNENGYVLEGVLVSCSFDYTDRTKPAKILVILMLSFGFVVPVLVIVLSGTYVVLYLRRTNLDSENANHNLNVQRIQVIAQKSYQTNTLDCNIVPIASLTVSSENMNRKTYFRAEKKILVDNLVNLFVFSLSWAPYVTITLLAQYAEIDYVNSNITPMLASNLALFAKIMPVLFSIYYMVQNKDTILLFLKIYTSSQNI